ncbi:peptidoglycan L-alanyl-D-glutamate endopeptidase CwlK [Cohnella sp. OV330]|uniref:M15 family metallopeptidase n=1 Tax=Cohnella sp. OV330 TaxID=1855288 RepID=UPI0008E845E5|nr:M15 family metallopeptidase [Cohnella sp. OV330]SFB62506.1 peptidoglycan L-alanyl-D-glutamate endopeptidase CwlK [Cohnella sp. OV330]
MQVLALEQVKAKSATKLAQLLPVVRAAAEKLIERCYQRGVQILITHGFRSYSEQNELYDQGRSKPGQIVTNAQGGYSFHNFGVAIDFALLLADGRQVSWNTLRDDDKDSLPDWSEVVEEAKLIGFEWGGDWRSFQDLPHFQFTFGITIQQYRLGRRPTVAQMNALFIKLAIIGGEEEMEDAIAIVNGKRVATGALYDPKKGITYLPVRAVTTALGGQVDGWDPKTKTVNVTVPVK